VKDWLQKENLMPEENPFKLAEILNKALEQASEYKLEAEVLQFTLQHLKITEDALQEATYHALSEWLK
jgi:hypothetical protein